MNSQRPLVGISMGDPAGVGPEVTVKTLNMPDITAACRALIIGDASVVQGAVDFCKLPLEVNIVTEPEAGRFEPGVVDVLDLANLPLSELQYGTVTAAQGRASYEYIARNIELAMAGRVHATVTGPINKAALNAGGCHFAGHTEIYAQLTGTRDYTMMLADGGFRVSHVSTHVALREACDRVRRERVLKVIELTHAALVQMDVPAPRLAVAGLNPHCGEGGLFGTEDEAEIAPAVRDAVARGLNVQGPLPADTVFSKMAGGQFDAVVCMYHDQGHIPTKLQGFRYDEATDSWSSVSGVNITLGLPIIRVSVDHGTAFDKAGEGRANPQSMADSVRLAARLAKIR